ncbi:hypothetical protein [Nonomuraea insulae]|uniref:Uncharacterized protein n=1 Tax=Nonomuraea insulae TaxID=1616787 RepID=A0ABW1D7W7_9ACTN
MDDFEIDAAAGCVLDGFVLVAVVGPGFGEGGVVGCEVVEEVGAGAES